MTSFAKNELLKYGWIEGKGLGKFENGIVQPLKPKIKLDTTGIGHDATDYKWWEFVYNKAANNLEVENNSQKVSVSVKDADAVQIKTTKSELIISEIKKKHSLKYGNFLQTSTLSDGKMVNNHSAAMTNEIEDPALRFVLKDEDLLKACKGRTAHKGARHGLTLSGKLARIERQEKELLEKKLKEEQELLQKTKSVERQEQEVEEMKPIEESEDWIKVENSKKKKKKKRKYSEAMDLEDSAEKETVEEKPVLPVVPEISEIDLTANLNSPRKPLSKKTKQKAKRRVEDLTHKLAISLDLADKPPEVTKTKKKKRKNSEETLATVENPITSDNNEPKRKKLNIIISSNEPINDNITEPLLKKLRLELSEAHKLNAKIEKKKKNKLQRKEKKKIEQLSDKLMSTLDLEENPSNSEEIITDINTQKKEEENKLDQLSDKSISILEQQNNTTNPENNVADIMPKKKKAKLQKKEKKKFGKLADKLMSTLELENNILNVEETITDIMPAKKKKKLKKQR